MLSRDKRFVEKLRDVVGIYLNPPDRALVLCVDEKSQIQALDRTQPLLPLRPGVPARQTHDYRRDGVSRQQSAFSYFPWQGERVIHRPLAGRRGVRGHSRRTTKQPVIGNASATAVAAVPAQNRRARKTLRAARAGARGSRLES